MPRPLNRAIPEIPAASVAEHLEWEETHQKRSDIPPFRMVLYSPPGAGKSSFAAEFPNCGFIIAKDELGIEILVSARRVPEPVFIWKATSFSDGKIQVRDDGKPGYTGSGIALIGKACASDAETICIDAATGYQLMGFTEHCKKYYNDDWTNEGFYAYQQGPKNFAARDWPIFIEALTALNECGKNVIVLCHSQSKPYKNPQGDDFEQFSPLLEKEVYGALARWSSMLLFMNIHVDVVSRGLRKKADDVSEKRFLYTDGFGSYQAKNQYGLSPLIQVGDSSRSAYEAFMKEYRKVW